MHAIYFKYNLICERNSTSYHSRSEQIASRIRLLDLKPGWIRRASSIQRIEDPIVRQADRIFIVQDNNLDAGLCHEMFRTGEIGGANVEKRHVSKQYSLESSNCKIGSRRTESAQQNETLRARCNDFSKETSTVQRLHRLHLSLQPS